MADGESRLIRLSPEADDESASEGFVEHEMTCFSGGTLEIYIEPQEPQPRLLIVGHLPVAQALVHLGKAMSYRVIVVDPELRETKSDQADEVLISLEQLADRINPTTSVVVATHGHFDEEALEVVLRSEAPYVGLVASRRRAAVISARLLERGVTKEELQRLKAPAGLEIRAQRGDEIALSIMAEIVDRRRSTDPGDWLRSLSGRSTSQTSDDDADPLVRAAPATDPVCGMTVEIDGALHRHEHDGVEYFFCCSGCRERFVGQPHDFITTQSGA